MQSFGLGTDPQSFCHYMYFIAKFEISPEIGSDVSSRYCCYGNHAAASKPI